jgi:hypothetical protein
MRGTRNMFQIIRMRLERENGGRRSVCYVERRPLRVVLLLPEAYK